MLVNRIADIIGIEISGWHEGVPDSSDNRVVEYLFLLFGENRDDRMLLSIDLDNHPIQEILSQDQLSILKSYQCQKIRELRQAAYKELSDPLYMAHIADGDSIDLFSAAREAVKKMYPWPGDYR